MNYDDYFIVPDLTWGNVYYVFHNIGGGYKETRIEIIGNMVKNINSLPPNIQAYIESYILPWHERMSNA